MTDPIQLDSETLKRIVNLVRLMALKSVTFEKQIERLAARVKALEHEIEEAIS